MPGRAKVGNFLRKKREGNLGTKGKGNGSQKGRGVRPDETAGVVVAAGVPGDAGVDGAPAALNAVAGLPGGQDTGSGPSLPNVIEVMRYLVDLGWKISKSPLYRHRDQGHLRPQEDGTFLIVDVLKFARKKLKRLDGGPGAGGDKIDEPVTGQLPKKYQVVAEKAIAETKKAKAQAEHWDIKTKILQRQYVERDKFDSALAARALVFKSDWENFFRSRAGEIVGIVEGNAQLIPDLIDYLLDNLEALLNRYSEENKEFKVDIDANRPGL